MDIKGIKTVCVAGWGKTGRSLTRMLLSLGKKVKVTERSQENYFPASLIKDFQAKGVEFEFGNHSESFIRGSGLIVISPGIDFFKSSLAGIAEKNQIPHTGELEFAFYFTKAKIIAITGTNGKTTTAYLAYRLLKNTKKKIYLGGNIGRPFSEFALKAQEQDLVVLEVSSFQLETIIKFRPYVAVLLNLEPDHLNRHKNFSGYLKAKMKIFQNQQKNDWAVINKGNNLNKIFFSRINSKIVYFSDEFGDENLSAAYKIAKIFGVTKADCFPVFSQYQKLPHRQQLIKVIDKIKFINDSKATNPASTVFALEATRSPVILIAGGKDKGFDYSRLANYARKIKKINLIGEAADKIKDNLGHKVKCQKFASLEKAVISAYKQATAKDTVLFSPMCSSFDMFSDYRQRGQKFIEIVTKISYDKQ